MSPVHHSTHAAQAIAQLDAVEDSLDLDIVVPPNDAAQIRTLRRVSPKALLLASEIVAAAPERFPEFGGLAGAAAYVAAMTPIADRAMDLAKHVQKSIGNAQAPAAQQTLALYGIVKNLGRLPENEAMREKIVALRAELAPPRSKPKLTTAEKAMRRAEKGRARRVQKALAVLAANGVPTPTADPTTPAAPSPPPVR